ncbi:MAG: response regulator receiver sensor signal transduction histidine kinase [Gemmatimonadetes bacterium]|nr:response regulator receiver sensor signal transduction histidine kinase [Gemmatimonadota bacterium]
MRVLIADDDAMSRALLGHVVAAMGHEHVSADDGELAWTTWREQRPSLAIVDIEMPQLDGLALSRRIREVDMARETFILVVTGREDEGVLEQVLDAGADDYMAKPVTPENLQARLKIAERRIAQDELRRRAERELQQARWLAGIGETTIALQHEINNPLSALLGNVELMMMDAKDAGNSDERLAVILEQAKRIADVVRRIARLRNPQSVEYARGSRMIDLSE